MQPPSRFRFELLTDQHDLTSFDCGNTALNDYLDAYAKRDVRISIRRTYLLLDYAQSPAFVVGYFTLCVDTAEFRHPIVYETIRYPLILLDYLARHVNYKRMGIGDALLIEAFRITADVAARVGVAGMHIREATKAGKRLYMREMYGFQLHPCAAIDRDKGLYLPINDIHAILNKLDAVPDQQSEAKQEAKSAED